MKLYAQQDYSRAGVSLYALTEVNGVRKAAYRPVWASYDPGEQVDPLLTIPQDAAQMLMQQLWDAGFRPNNGAGSSAQAEAMQRHINFAEGIARSLLKRL